MHSSLAWAALEQQQKITFRIGRGYDHLTAEQKALVQGWHDEYEHITGNQVDAKTGYDSLKLSVRTTFEAVTNALLQTKLTDSSGKPIGNALDLVKLVEVVHDEIPETRGDEQFRVYVPPYSMLPAPHRSHSPTYLRCRYAWLDDGPPSPPPTLQNFQTKPINSERPSPSNRKQGCDTFSAKGTIHVIPPEPCPRNAFDRIA